MSTSLFLVRESPVMQSIEKLSSSTNHCPDPLPSALIGMFGVGNHSILGGSPIGEGWCVHFECSMFLSQDLVQIPLEIPPGSFKTTLLIPKHEWRFVCMPNAVNHSSQQPLGAKPRPKRLRCAVDHLQENQTLLIPDSALVGVSIKDVLVVWSSSLLYVGLDLCMQTHLSTLRWQVTPMDAYKRRPLWESSEGQQLARQGTPSFSGFFV